MKKSIHLFGATALSSLLLSTPSFADVTAAQVWGDMQSYMQSFGYAMSAQETSSGEGVTLENLTMQMDIPDEADGSVSVTIPKITFLNMGDGRVEMLLPETQTMIMVVAAEGETVEVGLDLAQQGFSMIVSGTPEEMTYAYVANQMRIALAKLIVEGEVIGPDQARAEIVMNGYSGTTDMKVGNIREIVQDMALTGVTYDVMINDKDSGDGATITGSTGALTGSGTTTIPMNIDMQDMAAAMKAGFAFAFKMGYADSSMNFSFTESGDAVSGTAATATNSFDIRMSEDELTYAVAGGGSSFQIMGADIPFPVSFDLQSLGFNLTMPVSASPDEQDFALGMTLGGFTMADLLWNIVDPANALPRDPATVSFDLTGKAKLFLDLMDEKAMMDAGMSDEMPGELNALTITTLVVDAVGAKLTGTGDFTFDNTDLQTFDGMPRPIGGVDLNLSGANGLMDKLIQMGLMSQDDAMGARMMISMFAVPGDGEDTFKSKLEINEQGHILANGMRIQ
ncbi:DUF2125 domain-containing protein [Mesobacterium sp. TK19101]|uniref:DUF2125 domain-containing protein n=1 Tax=Mesobacterium hydrothermale TaxID=3111907 RepID=A0ABU6HFI1_9RHOB|nr:DUF2125 domain-containing protein [Mesobacterium sp. TK19101]MEC3860877.1 DUF2125 domain-containing protein [Mesobacterium sp. TK19101]